MDPKNNFLNGQPSIAVNTEPPRAENLSTTDTELEKTSEHDPSLKGGEFADLEQPVEGSSFDPGADEEA